MEKPLEISFRHMKISPAVEAKIREKVKKLTRLHDQIMSCRVVVEAPHTTHHQGNLFRVRLDLKMRGQELAINRHHPKDHAHEDVYVAIRDAFDAAARRLKEYSLMERRKLKHHEAPSHGRVVRLEPEKEHGYIETPEGDLIYFHRNSVLEGGYDKLKIGSEVRYSEEEGDMGPQASTVHLVGGK